MSDSGVVICDRTPLLQKKDSMCGIDAENGFLAYANDDRKEELDRLDREYGITFPVVDVEDVNPKYPDLGATQENKDIAAIFVVAFDTRAGNIIEWYLPTDCDLDGIEFRAMASGSHKVHKDFIYFKRGGLYGLACFENMPVENAEERGARMKSVGVLAESYTALNQHMSFLRDQVKNLLQNPGSYSNLVDYYNENKKTDRTFDAFGDSIDTVTNSVSPDFLPPLMKITHPAGCFSQFLKFFGENIFALWKMALLRKRVIFFSPPPIGVVCYRVYCTMCLSAHRITELGGPTIEPLFYVNVADVDHLESQKSYIACTTEKIFESKSNLFDLYVDNQNLTSDIPYIQKLLVSGSSTKSLYSQLCQIQYRVKEQVSDEWVMIDNDESWFLRFFMSLNEHLFSFLLSISRSQDKQFTSEHMQALGLDPDLDRLFIMELAETYGIDIVAIVDNSCCPSRGGS